MLNLLKLIDKIPGDSFNSKLKCEQVTNPTGGAAGGAGSGSATGANMPSFSGTGNTMGDIQSWVSYAGDVGETQLGIGKARQFTSGVNTALGGFKDLSETTKQWKILKGVNDADKLKESGLTAAHNFDKMQNWSTVGVGLTGAAGAVVGGKPGQALTGASSAISGGKQIATGIRTLKTAKAAGNLTKATKIAGAGNIAAGVGTVASVADSMFFGGGPREYKGKYGSTTRTADAIYDGIATGVQFVPGVGQIVGGAMQVAKLLGHGMNKLGAGTDGMTKQDAVLGSSFFNWNIGAINGALGKTANRFATDDDTLNYVGGSYNVNDMYKAAEMAGKKYGILSSGTRRKATANADFYQAQQQMLGDIAEEGQMSKDAGDYYGINFRNQMELQGDYQPLLAARNGLKLDFAGAHRIAMKLKFKQGGVYATAQAQKERQKQLKNLSQQQRQALEERQRKAKKQQEELKINTPVVSKHKDGGVIEEIWEPIIVTKQVEEFKNGGSVNVIPEGALHAHLNHMEGAGEDFTKKGIPVVTESKGGEIEQQAEIERNEIIFRKEVTEKLEKYWKDGSDEAAIKAGKLLVKEILYNTDDRTGLIDEVL